MPGGVAGGTETPISVPLCRFDGRFAGALILLSKTAASFKDGDVLVARRMADRLAISVARDREIQALKRADEATERAQALEARVRALSDELNSLAGFHRVVGESTEWRQALTQAAQVAATDTTVLLLGESGTGKEVELCRSSRSTARSRATITGQEMSGNFVTSSSERRSCVTAG